MDQVADEVATEAVKLPSFVKNIQPELQRMPREEMLAAIERIPDARVRARWRKAATGGIAGEFLYADAEGEELLAHHLKLEPAPRGENVTIDRPRDKGIFLENLEPKPGLRCTGLVQTFLDLAAAGDRGAEAADHLRQQKITPLWTEVA